MNICKIHGKNCQGECRDPNIDNGMMTKVWGPPGWLFLHCITFGYPFKIDHKNKDHLMKKKYFRNFFHNLGHVLPCKYCRNSYIEYMEELPIEDHLDDRKSITEWLYKMHNKINFKLGVPDCNIPSFAEIQNYYESFRAKCAKTTEEERENNLAKGCVTPADGTPRRSLLRVIKCEKGDITRRENSQYSNTNEELIIFKKYDLYLIIAFLIILFLFYAIFGDFLKKKIFNR